MATGVPYSTSVLTEVIDLADESTTCAIRPDFPIQAAEASGGLVNDAVPLVCGGFNRPNLISDCYDPISASPDPVATLSTPRAGSASVAIGRHLWVTGGFDGSSNVNSTEFVDIDGSVVEGPDLPIPTGVHCILKVNANTVFFMSGYKTFFFDYDSQVWTDGPVMNYDREFFGCGIMKMENGSVTIVAAGGAKSKNNTEFLSLDDLNRLNWTPGNDPKT